MDKEYFVYLITNDSDTVLYTGVTNNLRRRMQEHGEGRGSKFTKKYNLRKLVYFEVYTDPRSAIMREKQIKGGSRKAKIDLFKNINPDWKDLTSELPF